MEQRPALAEKKKVVEELASLLKDYRNVIIINSQRLRANLLNDMRLIFRERVLFRYVKPNLLRKAAEKIGDSALVDFARKHSSGPIILALTDEDPFKIANEFRRNSMELKAKAGDIAQSDIVVEPMNTGLPPGPVIAELNEAGLPTRIETGSVWITKRTVAAKAGDLISSRKAAALSKIGLKPIRLYLSPKAALYDGVEIEESVLKVEPSEICDELTRAVQEELIVSLEISYISEKTLPILISKAAMSALNLAIAIDYPTEEAIKPLIEKAQLEASALQSIMEKHKD